MGQHAARAVPLVSRPLLLSAALSLLSLHCRLRRRLGPRLRHVHVPRIPAAAGPTCVCPSQPDDTCRWRPQNGETGSAASRLPQRVHSRRSLGDGHLQCRAFTRSTSDGRERLRVLFGNGLHHPAGGSRSASNVRDILKCLYILLQLYFFKMLYLGVCLISITTTFEDTSRVSGNGLSRSPAS